jgi:mercuric ion binding protein
MKSISLLIAGLLFSLGAMAADTRTVTLDVTKMDCAVCPITVRKALEKVPGVGSAKVDPAKTSTDALTRATADAGFPSSVQQVQ